MAPSKPTHFNDFDYAKHVAQHARALHASEPSVQRSPRHISNVMNASTHAFVRVDAVRPPLEPSYAGPLRVTRRGPETLILDVASKSGRASIDRIIPPTVACGLIDGLF